MFRLSLMLIWVAEKDLSSGPRREKATGRKEKPGFFAFKVMLVNE